MSDATARAYAARRILDDETIMAALRDVQADIANELLRSATPEDREEKYHEWQGVERLRRRLTRYAGPISSVKD